MSSVSRATHRPVTDAGREVEAGLPREAQDLDRPTTAHDSPDGQSAPPPGRTYVGDIAPVAWEHRPEAGPQDVRHSWAGADAGRSARPVRERGAAPAPGPREASWHANKILALFSTYTSGVQFLSM